MPLDFSSPPIGFVFTLGTLVLLSLVWRLLGKPIRTVRATLHQAPSRTAGYLKTAGWYALRLGILFIALFLLGEISGPWLWSALALLVFG